MRLLTGLLLLELFGCEAKVPQISTDGIESVVVKVYKNDLFNINNDFKLTIPKTDWDNILSLTIPKNIATTGAKDIRIATLTIQYEKTKSLSVDIFFAGKNPCKVSLDGKHFYYAKDNPSAPVGPTELLRKVIAIRKIISEEKERDEKINPERQK